MGRKTLVLKILHQITMQQTELTLTRKFLRLYLKFKIIVLHNVHISLKNHLPIKTITLNESQKIDLRKLDIFE